MITWRSHLDKNLLKQWLADEFGDIKEIYIAHEPPDTRYNYEHTTCVLHFKERVRQKYKIAFNVWYHQADDGTNDNIQSDVQNILRSKESLLVC